MTSSISSSLGLPSGLVLKNRLVKAAMSERLGTPDGGPSEGLVRLYERWGAGGIGLLVTGNVMIDGCAVGEEGNVIVEDERHLAGLRAWAAAAKRGGAAVLMQINHPGRQSPRTLSREPVAPSVVPMKVGYGAFAPPRALFDQEIRDIVARFARTAAVAIAAGFDGVQIHGAHGYLVSQFLSPRTNLRDDEWGGDSTRRRRFLMEVVRAVRAAIGPKATLSVKLNSADFQRGGFSEDESMEAIAALDAEGIDLLEISGGSYENAPNFAESPVVRESTKQREAFFLDFAEKVAWRSKVPRMVTGGFRTKAGMDQALAQGATDLIGIARPLCVEPDLPARLLDGTAESASPVRLGIGIANLDNFVQIAWYEAQLGRMARGKEPWLGLPRLLAAAAYPFSNGARAPAVDAGPAIGFTPGEAAG